MSMTFNTKIGALLLAFLLGLMAIAGLGQGVLAHAQVISTSNQCLSLQSNVGYGSHDYSSGNAVTALQTFLTNQGYFSGVYLGTGSYGSITLRSVAQFQAANGIPATGFVGPLTRAAISQISCGTSVTPPSSNNTLSVYSVSPTSGVVGSTVTITGSGFTSSNTVLMDGNVAAQNVGVSSSYAIPVACSPLASSCSGGARQTLTFTVPSALAPYCAPGMACPQYMRLTTPGTYSISVLNSNGTSNTVTFTVTSGSTAQPLSISGLSAPASLALGQSGTWTVQVNSNGQGNLHYSVVWGDEATVYSNGIAASPVTNTQSSATFTHVYGRSGTYTPVFTVTNDSGASVSTSNSVVVTPLY
jgi:peptidoglycan hydrolase-like protein with peptidoglycan-binding domain